MLEPWTVADVESHLRAAGTASRLRGVATEVLAKVHAAGFPKPTLVMRATVVRFVWEPEETFGASVDRAGVVRVWALIPPVAFGEKGYVWRMKGTLVDDLVHELALRAGVERPGPQ
jgi:hypothetical protein